MSTFNLWQQNNDTNIALYYLYEAILSLSGGSSSMGMNVGNGVGVYNGNSGSTLEFLTLSAGSGTAITTGQSTVTISTTGGGTGTTTATANEYQLIGFAQSNLNATTDTPIYLSGSTTPRYIITDVLIMSLNNNTTSPASGGMLNTASGRAGTTIFTTTTIKGANTLAYISTPYTFLNNHAMTIGSLSANDGDYAGIVDFSAISSNVVYWSVSSPAGQAHNVYIYVFGLPL